MRPTSKNHVYIYSDNAEAKALWATLPTYVWEVELDELDPVTFEELYPDNCNANDEAAKQWLLANFKSMCPCSVDSDVFVDKNDIENSKWVRLDFEKAEETVKAPITEADKEAVETLLKPLGYAVYEREDDGLCVEVTTTSADGKMWDSAGKIRELDTLLSVGVGLELGEVVDTNTLRPWPCNGEPAERLTIWSIVPLDHEDEDSDEDESEHEDGWHGILLNHVFIVDDKGDAEVLSAAGYRVLEHEDTGTVVAQVAFYGMSSEANQAHAGFLLAVDRGWPILTDKGWRRPVR